MHCNVPSNIIHNQLEVPGAPRICLILTHAKLTLLICIKFGWYCWYVLCALVAPALVSPSPNLILWIFCHIWFLCNQICRPLPPDGIALVASGGGRGCHCRLCPRMTEILSDDGDTCPNAKITTSSFYKYLNMSISEQYRRTSD